MSEFTMQQLLARKGMADKILDSQLTRRIARELRRKGYRMVRRGNVRVWTDEIPDRVQLAQRITEGL
jgi:hypothetical protein